MISSTIFNMFGRSPIRPIQEHMDRAYAACKSLLSFFQASISGDWEQANKIRDEIESLEKEADSLKRDLRLHLPDSLFLPVPRTDILQVLDYQGKLVKKAKGVSGLVIGREIQLPSAIVDSYMAFLARCIDAVKQARKAIMELDELLATGFRGNEARLVKEMIEKLDEVEDDTDEMQVQIRRQVFEIEKDLEPVDTMFLYKVLEWTGDLADRAQAIGNQLLLLLAR
jgi:predicted phosphate transport protein (TIGR00153 family)